MYSAVERLRDVRAYCFNLLTDSRHVFLVGGLAANLGRNTVILRVLASFLWEPDTNPCLDRGQCTHYVQSRIIFFCHELTL